MIPLIFITEYFFIFFCHYTSLATINAFSFAQLFSCPFVFLFQPREDNFKGERRRKKVKEERTKKRNNLLISTCDRLGFRFKITSIFLNIDEY